MAFHSVSETFSFSLINLMEMFCEGRGEGEGWLYVINMQPQSLILQMVLLSALQPDTCRLIVCVTSRCISAQGWRILPDRFEVKEIFVQVSPRQLFLSLKHLFPHLHPNSLIPTNLADEIAPFFSERIFERGRTDISRENERRDAASLQHLPGFGSVHRRKQSLECWQQRQLLGICYGICGKSAEDLR